MAELFGFEFKRKGVKKEEDLGSFAPKIDDEGSIAVAEGGAYGTYVDRGLNQNRIRANYKI